MSADSQFFCVVKKFDIFLGVLSLFSYEEHAFKTKRFLPLYFFKSIYHMYYFCRLNFQFSEPEDLIWFLKCLRLAILPLPFKFFLHCGTFKYISRKPFSQTRDLSFFPFLPVVPGCFVRSVQKNQLFCQRTEYFHFCIKTEKT